MEVGNKEVEKWTFPREKRKGELYVVHGARLQGRRMERGVGRRRAQRQRNGKRR